MKYIQEFIDLKSKDEEVEKLLFLSIAILSEIILERKYFTKNIELKNFTNKLLNQEYKDYLFDSRPTLFARLVKDLRKLKTENKEVFFELSRLIQIYVESNLEKEDLEKNDNNESNNKQKNKVKRNNHNVINDWRSVIESER